MSLVNDMLRDLEARRAAPGEWPLRDGLQAVDEAGAARRERTERLRRGLIWLGAVILLGVMVGLMIGRVVNGDPPPFFASEPVANTPVVVPPAPRVLEVLPQNDGRRLLLQVLLDSSVAYQRSEESGAVSLFLPGVQMGAEPYQGRVQKAGRSLSWRVEAKGDGVQILLVGLGEQLQLSDRLEPAGDRWLLWLEVPLQAAAAEAVEPAVEAFAPATAAPVEVEAPLPDWASRSVPAASPRSPTGAPTPAAKEPVVEPPSGPPQVRISSHQANPRTQAHQHLLEQDYPRAIRELEALHASHSRDLEVVRWLAQAYQGAGQSAQLLAWLPAQLRQHPQDAELRMLLARAQLQSGAMAAAVATLSQQAPALSSEPGYHALLAASYQQTRQWAQSAAVYRQLVALRQAQATWQLGLAIALEQLEQPTEAVKHYRLALQGQGLDDSSRRFASERAGALKEPS
ncbi:tetratricopeptide repeat protein [Pseudomonas sp.]|uniref:tetratricopeptide repeat protein n=1 Tax=Pseudomonas sp. TaxID=306 RepID=UPI003BB52090